MFKIYTPAPVHSYIYSCHCRSYHDELFNFSIQDFDLYFLKDLFIQASEYLPIMILSSLQLDASKENFQTIL